MQILSESERRLWEERQEQVFAEVRAGLAGEGTGLAGEGYIYWLT